MIDMCLCSHCARIFPQKELREYSMPMLHSTLPSRDRMADKSKDILTVKKRLCPQCCEELAELVWRWSTYGWEDEENSRSD